MGQQTLREVSTVWYSWRKAMDAYKKNPSKFTGRPCIPGYLPKGKRHTFHVTSQTVKVKDGYLIINPRVKDFCFKLKLRPGIKNVKQVTFKPLSKGYFKVIVEYAINSEIKYLPDNHRYLGIDPGLDNAFTCVVNDPKVQPLIINGRGAKSINHYYNKQISKLNKLHVQYKQCFQMGYTKQGPKPFYYYSNRQKQITAWRNEKIRQFSHQATKRILDYALSNDVNTIVIGKNKGWKRSIDLGKKTNQNFVGIPHQKIINMLKYKANLHGISVIQTNESYTSQTSALDNEKPCKQNGTYQRKQKGLKSANRRIHRGLFKTNHGILINADVNGAMQIVRKAFPEVSFAKGIRDAVLRPIKWNASI